MELLTLSGFCLVLLICLGCNLPILLALSIGLFLFSIYAYKKGFSPKEILLMYWNGIRTIKGILTTFLMIGILTASWRIAGTIPTISLLLACYLYLLPACYFMSDKLVKNP